MTVIGIDISKWNGNWDAQKAKAAGAQFVFVKSSQSCFVDPRFSENWKNAREAGLLRGAYHYLDYTKPALDQAKYFSGLLKEDPGELPVVVDFEQPRDDNNINIPKSFLRQFVEHLQSDGNIPIIYTSPSFWKTYGDSSTYWYQFPLWIANYTLASAPIVPPPWLSWEFWQFSKKGPGQLFGSEALDIDINRFNGSLEELYTLAKREPKSNLTERIVTIELRLASIEKILEQQSLAPASSSLDFQAVTSALEPETIQTAVVTGDQVLVRVGPFAALPSVGQLARDSKVEIIESQAEWSKIKSPLGWVENSALQMPSEIIDIEQDDGEYMVCRARALNIRSGPGSSFPIVGWLESGQRIKVLDRNSGWVQLEAPEGWSMETYLSPV
ncbi:MAG: hypothetical protein CVU44_06155 [Chloroflexi bacterium HGW-Chloroflexi-6]|nr:MAG: hypothetical protein CVU44_06155 [Chloroflexi bacterium HGW-Chloroflexi-6]